MITRKLSVLVVFIATVITLVNFFSCQWFPSNLARKFYPPIEEQFVSINGSEYSCWLGYQGEIREQIDSLCANIRDQWIAATDVVNYTILVIGGFILPLPFLVVRSRVFWRTVTLVGNLAKSAGKWVTEVWKVVAKKFRDFLHWLDRHTDWILQ